MRRILSGGCLAAIGLFLASPIPSIAEQNDEGFLTNLALLETLTHKAVSALLDSLAFQRGEMVTIVAGSSSEGNDFVAESFAKALARRGYEVRVTDELLREAPTQPAQGSAQTASTPQGPVGTPLARADSSGAPVDSSGTLWNPDSSGTSIPTDTLKNGATAPAANQNASGHGDAGGGTPENYQPPRPQVAEHRVLPEGQILEFRVLEFGVHYPSVRRRYLAFGAPTVRRLAGVYLQACRLKGPEGQVIDVASGQSHVQDRLAGRSQALAEGANYPFTKPTIPASNVGRYVEPIAVVGIITSLVYLFYQNQH